VAAIAGGLDEQRGEQVLESVAGQPDQPGWWRVAGAVGSGQDHQEGVGDHAQGGPVVPGAPAADLVLVQAGKALAGVEGLLNGPAPPGDLDQDGQRGGAGSRAAVVGQLAGRVVAADQQPVLARLAARSSLAMAQAQERPLVQAVALGALAARELLPRPRRDTPEQGVGTLGGATEAHPVVAGDRQHLADPAGLQLGPNPGLAP
jgi:hypothetical protein